MSKWLRTESVQAEGTAMRGDLGKPPQVWGSSSRRGGQSQACTARLGTDVEPGLERWI